MMSQKILDKDSLGVWLCVKDSTIFFVDDQLPRGRASAFGLQHKKAIYLGLWDSLPLYLVDAQQDVAAYVSLRSQLGINETQFNLLNRGVALHHFLQTNQFCGKCGGAMQMASDEWAMQCQNEDCHHRIYPVICPSIIVAVRRGKQILLANHLRHQASKIYTVLAGFVEVGETFEQAVVREVWEESQIKIKNLRYFGSQPWAFPNAQMVGFLADYADGEIQVQQSEIHDEQWFDYDQHLPELPPQGTIAHKLIQATLALCEQEEKESK
ncbi:MAG: NAD(+) diphosphatase [Pasteurellaceae bacterium]|nr:NAD(+) diphosphatase [Pasteurellaceae bacterium]